MLCRPVLLAVLLGGAVLAVHDSVLDVESFSGWRVYRVSPASEEEIRQLIKLQDSPFYDFWTEVLIFGGCYLSYSLTSDQCLSHLNVAGVKI